jgi:DNA-binding transcriptional LysR family regulator
MTLNARRLRYFIAVAEELHFGRAAVRLGMAQPPLTQQIQKLERELGYKVFERTKRKTQLTSAGQVLLDEARRLTDEHRRAIERVQRAGRGETGELTVATPPSVMLGPLPAAIRQYRTNYPEVHFALREGSTSAIAEALKAGTADIGLLREMDAVGTLQTELLFREPLVAVLPRDDALVRKTRLALSELATRPFILFPRSVGEAFYDRLLALCVEAGFSPHVIQVATQWQSVVSFVETGLGVSVAPASVQRLQFPGVVFRPLTKLSTSVFVCVARNEPLSTAFLETLRRHTRRWIPSVSRMLRG